MSTCSLSVLTLHHFKTISTTTHGWIPVPAFSVKYLIASYEVVRVLSQFRSSTEWAVKAPEEDGRKLVSKSILFIVRNASTFAQTLDAFCKVCLQRDL